MALTLNATGAEVEALHRDLDKISVPVPAFEVEKQVFGVGTRNALMGLQRGYGLNPTGEFDDATRSALAGAVTVVQSGLSRVEGRIVLENGTIGAGLALRLYRSVVDQDSARIASAKSDEQGFYVLPHSEGEGVSLEVRLVDADDKETLLAGVRTTADRYAAINLVVPAASPAPNEFAALAQSLVAELDDRARIAEAKESGDRRDLTLLHQKTGWDARVLALAASAERLHQASGIPPEAAYALLRTGLPSDPTALAAVGAEAVGLALEKALASGLIAVEAPLLGQAKAAYAEFAREQQITAKAEGQIAAPAEFLERAELSEDERKILGKLYFVDQMRGEKLWQSAAEEGLREEKIKTLRLQGKLAYLTRNNAILTATVQQELGEAPSLAGLVDKGLYTADAWKQRLRTAAGDNDAVLEKIVPGGAEGTSLEQRVDAYAHQLARDVRLCDPTRVAERMVARDELRLGPRHAEIKGPALTVLGRAAASKLDIERTSVARVMRESRDQLFAGIDAALVPDVEESLKSLQRVRQITPSDTSTGILLEDGIGSAAEVLAFDFDAWLERYRDRLPKGEPELIWQKARQVRAVTFNLFNGIRAVQAQPAVLGVSPAQDGDAAAESREDLLKNYPTLETLFGSLDYAACEHCRSVLSPAAYFVDLLRLLDPDPAPWEQFLTSWRERHDGEEYTARYQRPFDALMSRRPELAHLPLTCENTETAMPYIDVVNEILEYAVANGQLAPQAGRSTGDANSIDLLTEPLHVIPRAYEILAEARYPRSLPFGLWLETVRRFFAHFGTPFWQALEMLRPTDELEPPPGAAYGRSAIFAEQLGIGAHERKVLTAEQPLDEWHRLYGFDDPNRTAAENQEVARLTLASAKELARRLDVSYAELGDLVRIVFVNPALEQLAILKKLGLDAVDVARLKGAAGFPALSAGEQAEIDHRLDAFSDHHAIRNFDARQWLDDTWVAGGFGALLVLHGPPTSDFAATRLELLNGAPVDDLVFAKLALFVRLWKRLGWTMSETDCALGVLIPILLQPVTTDTLGPAMAAVISYLAHAHALATALPLGREGGRMALLSFWSELDTGGADSLYARLFLKRGALEVDSVFDHPLGGYLTAADPNTNQARPFTWDGGPAEDVAAGRVGLENHLGPVQAALRLSAAEIEPILAEASTTLAAAPLNLATLSRLHRHAILARGLRLSVTQLMALKQLTGLDPFAPIAADPPAKIADDRPFTQTMGFIAAARLLKDSGVSVEDLDWLLRHRFDPVGKYRDDPAAALDLMRSLGGEIARIRAEHAIPADPLTLTDEQIAAKLALGLPPEGTQIFLAMWTGQIVLEVEKREVEDDAKIPPAHITGEPSLAVAYRAGSRVQRLARTGVLPRTELARIKGAIVELPLLDELLDAVDARQQALLAQHFSAFLREDDLEPLFAPTGPDADEVRRRRRLAERLMPFLRDQLVRRAVVEAMTATTGGERTLVDSLLTDPGVLAQRAGASLVEALSAASERGTSGWFSADPGLTGLPQDPVRLDSASTVGKPAEARSGRIEGYLEVREGGAYRFFVRLDRANSEAVLFLGDRADALLRGRADGNSSELSSGAIDLKPGVAYRFVLETRNLDGGDARVLVVGDALAKAELSALTLYPAAAVAQVSRAAILLDKVLRLAGMVGLTEPELRHLAAHPDDFASFALSRLPTSRAEGDAVDAPAMFAGLRALLVYGRLKQELGGGTLDLLALLQVAHRRFPSATGTDDAESETLETVHQRLAGLTRRAPEVIAAALAHLGFKATTRVEGEDRLVDVAGLAEPERLARLWELLQLSQGLRVPVERLAAWATPSPDFEVARDLRNTLKGLHEPEAWRAGIKPVFDALRQKQRDALVTYLLHREDFAQIEKLFEHYLVDPGMEPVVLTSRLQLAIASVQTFIQRCLLNLERDVHPSAINATRWTWMKRYRIWEANRKIFLFPENWLEPEFRDDQSHLFQELMGALLEGQASDDLVEEAFHRYLQGLEEIARLEIVSLWSQVDPASASRGQLHVLARTAMQPHKYFYRAAANGIWEPWVPVGIDIEGDHACMVTWRGRVHVFWVTFIPKGGHGAGADEPIENAAERTPAELSTQQIQIRLSWCEYFEGSWQGPYATMPPDPAPAVVAFGFDPRFIAIYATKEHEEDGVERAVWINLSGSIAKAFRIVSRHAQPALRAPAPRPPVPYAARGATAGRHEKSGGLSVTFVARVETRDDGSRIASQVTIPVLEQGEAYSIVTSGDPYAPLPSDVGPLVAPFFYQDDANTFFVEPDLTATTAEHWEEWVVPPVEPDPVWKDPIWWANLPVTVKEPIRTPKIPVEAGDPAPWIDARVVTERPSVARQDWLDDPRTLVAFDDRAVGIRGGFDLVATPTIAGVTAGTIVTLGGVGGAVVGGSIISAHHAGALNGAVVINGAVNGAGISATDPGLGGTDNRNGVAANGAGSGVVIGTLVGGAGLGSGAFGRIGRGIHTGAVFTPGRIGSRTDPIR